MDIRKIYSTFVQYCYAAGLSRFSGGRRTEFEVVRAVCYIELKISMSNH
jgi:hypothetical protein